MGKVRVYASGAVKLVLGNVQFDMAPGNPIACAQQLAAIDSAAGKVRRHVRRTAKQSSAVQDARTRSAHEATSRGGSWVEMGVVVPVLR